MVPPNSPQKVCEAAWYLLVSMVALRWPVVGFTLVIEQKDGFWVEVRVFPSTFQHPLHGFDGLRKQKVFAIHTILASYPLDERIGVGGRIAQDFLMSFLMALEENDFANQQARNFRKPKSAVEAEKEENSLQWRGVFIQQPKFIKRERVNLHQLRCWSPGAASTFVLISSKFSGFRQSKSLHLWSQRKNRFNSPM